MTDQLKPKRYRTTEHGITQDPKGSLLTVQDVVIALNFIYNDEGDKDWLVGDLIDYLEKGA